VKKQYPLLIYYGLSIGYSVLFPIIAGCIALYNVMYSSIFFNISCIANLGFFFTHFCPFRIYARWYYHRHLNMWTMLRRTYKSQGRWIFALIVYVPAAIVFVLGILYLIFQWLR